MIATKRTDDKASHPFTSEDSTQQEVVFRFQAPAIPLQRAAAAGVKRPAATQPKPFDWFVLTLYVLFAIGVLGIAGLFYAVFSPPVSAVLP